jgi:methylenetetrahydrofolate reductase (NADPH)
LATAGEPYGRLHAALQRGDFVVTAEIGPPRGATVEPIRRKARLLRDWVDAANLTDNQSAIVRLNSLVSSLIVRDEGVEPITQFTCRDRNRMALQSDLVSAGAMGLPNVLLLTGDHPRFGDHPDAKPVFDLDSITLLWTARTLRDKKQLLSGFELKQSPQWLIGAVENPFAPPLKFRAERLGKKVAAGAQFIQTQYIFDVEIFARFMADVRALGLDEKCKVIAGVGPIRSLRALEHMRHDVPGLYIPDAVVNRLKGVPAEKVGEEGQKLCAETIQAVREITGVAGVHVMAFGAEEVVPEILERAGIPRLAERNKSSDQAKEPVHAV